MKSGEVLAVGESVTVDYTNAPHLWLDTKTREIITDPEEIMRLEEEAKPIREKVMKMYNEWKKGQV